MDLMIEDTGEQRLLLAEAVEVPGLPRRPDVAAAFVLAVDRFLRDERFQFGDGVRCDVEQLPGARLPEFRDERGGLELEPGQHVSAVARTGAPADLFAFDNQHGRARPRQLPRGREPGITGADDHDIGARR